jgi:hypothetical protein
MPYNEDIRDTADTRSRLDKKQTPLVGNIPAEPEAVHSEEI